MSAPQGNWWVICPEREIGPLSRSSAERRLAEIEKLDACKMPHRIEQR